MKYETRVELLIGFYDALRLDGWMIHRILVHHHMDICMTQYPWVVIMTTVWIRAPLTVVGKQRLEIYQ